MHSLLILVILSLLQACASAQLITSMNDSPNSADLARSQITSASTSNRSQPIEFNLSDHLWQDRIVLVFAPSGQSSAYQQQMQSWQMNGDGIRDRDLKLVEVLETGTSQVDQQPITPASAARLRQQFGVKKQDFVVILVGKDGTEKQRTHTPIEPSLLFRTIDAMPMRQQEMRSRS